MIIRFLIEKGGRNTPTLNPTFNCTVTPVEKHIDHWSTASFAYSKKKYSSRHNTLSNRYLLGSTVLYS